MAGTVRHCNITASLDGKIARPDGSVDCWLAADFPAEDFGFGAFLASVDAILMGRANHDAVRRLGDGWPYPGKPTVVATNRPLRDPPPLVEARSGDMAGIAAELERRGHRRVWIAGGGQVVRSMIAIGKLDVLEMALIPTVLGEGVPLFPEGTGRLNFRLVRCEAKAKGALHLVYERAAWGGEPGHRRASSTCSRRVAAGATFPPCTAARRRPTTATTDGRGRGCGSACSSAPRRPARRRPNCCSTARM